MGFQAALIPGRFCNVDEVLEAYESRQAPPSGESLSYIEVLAVATAVVNLEYLHRIKHREIQALGSPG